jgi:ABC-2 type transport system permease protein
MKIIFKLALLELKTLFYSPVAWLVLIVFTIQTGLDYTDIMENLIRASTGPGNKEPGITSQIFGGSQGLLVMVQNRLYLYIPILTMGLMSREISSGSIKLLLSSPITIGQIIWSKFLGILCYFFLLILVLGIVMAVTAMSVPHADITLMFSGLVGIFLMTVVYASLGLFMSSLTAYQPIAALTTCAVLAALNFIGSVWQDVDLLRNAASFLAINGRTEQIINGLISTRQLSYFFIIAALFLGLTVLRLKFEQQPKPVRVKVFRYSSLVLIALLAGYISSQPRFTAYFDMTATKDQTITDTSQIVLSNIKHPVKVHTYVNMLDDDNFLEVGLPKSRNTDKNFFDRFQRFLKHEIQIDYTYYYDSLPATHYMYLRNPGVSLKNLAENVADTKGFDTDKMLDSSAIKKVIDLKPRNNRFVRQFEIDGKTTMVGLYHDQGVVPGEREMMDAIKLLNKPKNEVAFLTGHNERIAIDDGAKDRDYNKRLNTLTDRQSMVNHGFRFREISIDSGDIDKDISLLIIADPTLEIKPHELERIQKYIDEGRNLLIMGESGHRQITEQIIKPLGVRFQDGVLLSESQSYAPNFLIARFAENTKNYSRVLTGLYEDKAALTTTGASALVYDTTGPFTIEPFLVTNKATTWNHKGTIDPEAEKILFDPLAGDKKDEFPIAVTLRRDVKGREQRIMIFGDADILSDGQFSGVPKRNWELTSEMFKWFTFYEFPLDIFYARKPDGVIAIDLDEVSLLRGVFVFVIPAVLLLFGSVLLIRRMRQ